MMSTRQGFTLIELMVTIAIIAILSSIVYASFNSTRVNSRNKSLTVELKEVQLALETYRAQKGSYPLPTAGCGSAAAGQLAASDDGASTWCAGGYIDALVPEFITVLPTDDLSSNPACNIEYRTDTAGSWYKLTAINCLQDVTAATGVGAGQPLARCASTCPSSGRCVPTSADYYRSLAVYSLGGQCQ